MSSNPKIEAIAEHITVIYKRLDQLRYDLDMLKGAYDNEFVRRNITTNDFNRKIKALEARTKELEVASKWLKPMPKK